MDTMDKIGEAFQRMNVSGIYARANETPDGRTKVDAVVHFKTKEDGFRLDAVIVADLVRLVPCGHLECALETLRKFIEEKEEPGDPFDPSLN